MSTYTKADPWALLAKAQWVMRNDCHCGTCLEYRKQIDLALLKNEEDVILEAYNAAKELADGE